MTDDAPAADHERDGSGFSVKSIGDDYVFPERVLPCNPSDVELYSTEWRTVKDLILSVLQPRPVADSVKNGPRFHIEHLIQP